MRAFRTLQPFSSAELMPVRFRHYIKIATVGWPGVKYAGHTALVNFLSGGEKNEIG